MTDLPSYRVGETTITLHNSGLLIYDMADGLGVPAADWPPDYAADFAHPLHVPMLAVLVQTPQTRILVDAGSYDLAPDSPMRVPNYTPPPPIQDQLRALGVDPASIEHLVITHLHLDHYNGLTEERDGRRELCFPNATVYIGAADWADEKRQSAVTTPGSPEAVTLGEVARQARLVPVDAAMTLAPGVEILPLPGETPGHLGLRVVSQGQVAYIVGDLFHHVVEVEHPDWHVTWADRPSMAETRRMFFAMAAHENPLVIASHIARGGWLEQTHSGWRWRTV